MMFFNPLGFIIVLVICGILLVSLYFVVKLALKHGITEVTFSPH